MTLQIRPAAGPDVPAIANFAALTFREAFGAGNRPEDMALYLSANYSTEHQMRELTDPAWTTLGGDYVATATETVVAVPVPASPCFFRVSMVW